MDIDWSYWLGRKYDVMQQNANADTTRANAGMISANAGANLDKVRAGLLPAESAANIGLTNAQAANTNEQTKYVGPRAKADIYATTNQGSLYGAQTVGESQLNRLSSIKLGGLGDSTLESRLREILAHVGLGLPAN